MGNMETFLGEVIRKKLKHASFSIESSFFINDKTCNSVFLLRKCIRY